MHRELLYKLQFWNLHWNISGFVFTFLHVLLASLLTYAQRCLHIMKHLPNSYPLKCIHDIFSLLFDVDCTIYVCSIFNLLLNTFQDRFEAKTVAGCFYTKDVQGLQNLRQDGLRLID